MSYCVAPNPGDSFEGVLPVGSMLLWSTTTAPSGFLLCNGQAVNRQAFASLFAVIGTIWGIGDGSTTFNVPNTAGRVVRGVDGGLYTQGSTGGAESVILAANQLPNHAHSLTDPGHQHTTVQQGPGFATVAGGFGNTCDAGGSTSINPTGITVNNSLTVGGVQQTQIPTSIVNTFVAINYIIRAF